MLKVDGCLGDAHLRCAKRSSAAVRTAIGLEAAAEQDEVEMLDAVTTSPCSKEDANQEMGRLRRDTKNCLDQQAHAVACGDLPLLIVDVLGKAVRTFGSWYCICCFCGALTRMTSKSFFSGHPCCNKCDVEMLLREKAEELRQAALKHPSPKCRFCGKPENSSSATRWKVVASPADDGGSNAFVPPPLRKCYYCPSHWRTWLVAAHKSLPTNVIFAHLSHRAKPMFGADSGKRSLDEAEKQSAVVAVPAGQRPRSRKLRRLSKMRSKPS